MRLVLGGDLRDVYLEIYQLVSRLHFTPEYVESISPVERRIYLAEYRQEQKDQEDKKNDTQSNSRILGNPLDYT